jgi:putative redox protein
MLILKVIHLHNFSSGPNLALPIAKTSFHGSVSHFVVPMQNKTIEVVNSQKNSMARIQIHRKSGDYGFEATDQKGYTVRMDTSPETGGKDFGARPMQLLLMGLGGCSGMDIVSILNKQRQTVEDFDMTIEGEREKGKDPTLWDTVQIIFHLHGEIDPDKAKKACELSMEKYCSVAATLRMAGCTITWEVRVNEKSSTISK